MLSIRSNPLSYLTGSVVVALGGFLLILPSFLVAATADSQTSPTAVPILVAGAILGLPLVATGVTLTQKQYHRTLFLAVLTGIIYVAVPTAISGSFRPSAVYLPAGIVFFAVFLALLFVATVRLTS